MLKKQRITNTDKDHGLVMVPFRSNGGELGHTYIHTKKNGHYQTYYLPCSFFAVDKNAKIPSLEIIMRTNFTNSGVN